ncbi:hypothetical protein [Bordetella petrii]|uniref:Uncharacterized protein n=1 Tax=Bordetella petrii (strain ATCC BAA-461 / DSM 12804 / CCUG 43448 / CIP 107267 / Se-1111R) TaxID=340100 RepID=A9IRW4_BORPD|nr:hypothetical protein [Bordetella petrii]CAP43225.1 hypothetical protein predicted by Glimmer/Critica [Bordetella petrii]
MDEMKKADAGTSASDTTFVNCYPNSTAVDQGDQLLFTAEDFRAWHQANADQLAAKRATAEAVRQAERAARLEAFTDATIRAVAAMLEDGHTLDEACKSLIGNAFRFGACHETLNELVAILESLGWEGSVC